MKSMMGQQFMLLIGNASATFRILCHLTRKELGILGMILLATL
jgi:hypothetical protein